MEQLKDICKIMVDSLDIQKITVYCYTDYTRIGSHVAGVLKTVYYDNNKHINDEFKYLVNSIFDYKIIN